MRDTGSCRIAQVRTPLSSHELALGYKDETVDSIYVKMRLKGSLTSRCWSGLPHGLCRQTLRRQSIRPACAKARVGDEYVYVVKERVESVLGSEVDVVDEVPGQALEYLEYETAVALRQGRQESLLRDVR